MTECPRAVGSAERLTVPLGTPLLCTPDGSFLELGTPRPAAVLGHVGGLVALAVRHALFIKVRWIQLPSEGIPVAVTT